MKDGGEGKGEWDMIKFVDVIGMLRGDKEEDLYVVVFFEEWGGGVWVLGGEGGRYRNFVKGWNIIGLGVGD